MATYLRNQIAKLTGVSSETIRYYEKRGLIEPQRMENGYRIYLDDTVDRLNFIKHSKEAGFTLEETRQTLQLFHYQLNSEEISNIMAMGVKDKIQRIDEQIDRLMEMRKVLMKIDEGLQQKHQCPSMQGLLNDNQ